MGEANDLSAAVEAARLLPDVEFVLMGTESAAPQLQLHAPENVAFPGAGSLERGGGRLAARSDACLTLFKDVPVLATNSPNKLFDTFAAGRPAIVNMNGWMRALVEANDAGLYVRAGDASDLAEKLGDCATIPARRERMGRNARALAEREFDRDGLAERALELLEEAARPVTVELSYCVVNTNGRDDLLACLEAIAATHPDGCRTSCSCSTTPPTDGSADAVRERLPGGRR